VWCQIQPRQWHRADDCQDVAGQWCEDPDDDRQRLVDDEDHRRPEQRSTRPVALANAVDGQDGRRDCSQREQHEVSGCQNISTDATVSPKPSYK